MARPEKHRNIQVPPRFNRFKPVEARNCDLEQLILNLNEYESLRLADYDGPYHCDAAKIISELWNKIMKILIKLYGG